MFECLALGSGTIRRCGLVGVGVALLEEVHHCGGGLSNPILKSHPVRKKASPWLPVEDCSVLLSENEDVERSAPLAPCQPA